ncbi:MAG TPA: hypothetical protein P5320_02250 [Bacteroidales bacterium]|nr:hypothetical protein [Bacteroidales bacterium]HRR15517.1 hypothetical protein [Bacteroidales bacterium]HRT46905.1 hypothetical protein [Bacteroidales bacterium]HRU55869.1 hypothetical protein [Bacteroidales bacterium]
MDWKDQLGSYFTNKGRIRTQELANMLSEWLKEWTKYLNGFEHVNADYGIIPLGDIPEPWHYVRVYGAGTNPICFKAYLGYKVDYDDGGNAMPCLKIKSTIRIDEEAAIHYHMWEIEKNIDRLFIWTEDFETFYEPEIYEKDYVLSLLNERFIEYCKRTQLL